MDDGPYVFMYMYVRVAVCTVTCTMRDVRVCQGVVPVYGDVYRGRRSCVSRRCADVHRCVHVFICAMAPVSYVIYAFTGV